MFAEIAGLDCAAVPDLDRRDIGTDRADVVGGGFNKQCSRLVGGAHDGGVRRFADPPCCAMR